MDKLVDNSGTPSGALSFAEALEALTPKQRAYVMAYLQTLSKTQAARNAKLGKTEDSIRQIGCIYYQKPNVKAAIDAGFKEAGMGPGETLARIADFAHHGLEGILSEVEFDEPVYGNVPTQRVIDELELQQSKHEMLADRFSAMNPKKAEHHEKAAQDVQERIIELQAELFINPQHTTRRQVGTVKRTRLELDLVKARDAGKLHLVQKLTWTKEGPSIHLESKLKALELLARSHGLLTDNTNHGGEIGLKLIREEVGGPLD